jgi:hypothetical protein
VKGRQESRGPRIISRYNAEAKRVLVGREQEEHIVIHGYVGEEGRGDVYATPPSREQLDAQQREPVKIRFDTWLYRDRWVHSRTRTAIATMKLLC